MPTLRQVVQSVAKEWTVEHNEMAIRETVRAMLDEHLETVIASAAGCELEFGKWRIVHYSGVDRWIETAAKDAVKQYLDEHLASELPKLTDTIREIVVKEYRDAVLAAINRDIWSEARDQAAAILEHIIGEEAEKVDIENIQIVVEQDENEDKDITNPWTVA